MALLDDLRAMAIFATVVRHGSFASAARALGLTRAVVSHHVRMLEKSLGVALAHRSTRSFSLTPAGETFRIHCERILDEAQDGVRSLELLRGEVRMTCSPHFGSKLILTAVLEFRRRYPAVRVQVVMSEAKLNLVQHGVELAVRAGPLADSALHARKLVSEPTMLCASPSYLRRHGSPTSIAELARHRWVIYPPSQNRIVVEGVEVKIQGDVLTDSASARLAFVLGGEGIARLPAYDAAGPLASGDLVRVLPDIGMAPLDIFLVHAKRISPSARLLRDFLLEAAPAGE